MITDLQRIARQCEIQAPPAALERFATMLWELPPPSIWVFHLGERLRIPCKDVMRLRSERDSCWLTTAERDYLCSQHLGQILKQHPHEWIRVHRSHAVRRTAVHGITIRGHLMQLRVGAASIPVARRRHVEVQRALRGGGKV